MTVNESMVDYYHVTTFGLTLAGLCALKPPVVYVFVGTTSAVLEPSTARSATTDSTGFRKPAALWANHPTKDR